MTMMNLERSKKDVPAEDLALSNEEDAVKVPSLPEKTVAGPCQVPLLVARRDADIAEGLSKLCDVMKEATTYPWEVPARSWEVNNSGRRLAEISGWVIDYCKSLTPKITPDSPRHTND